MNDTYNRSILLAELKEEEGERGRPYDDATGNAVRAPIGNVTIAIGWNLDANPLPVCVMEYMAFWMIDRCEEIWDSIDSRWRTLDQPRQRVLLQMAFQLGPVKLLKFRKMIVALRESFDGDSGAMDRVADEIKDSKAYRDFPKRWGRHEQIMRKGEV